MGKVTADIVTISRPGSNQTTANAVGGEPRAVSGPGEYEVAGVLIAGVATAIEPKKGSTNTAYVLRFDELSVCHLGALDSKLTDQQVEELGNINVLLVPVGGGGAIGPTAAAEVVSQLEPSIVIPMRYRQPDDPDDGLEPVDVFCREMGSKEWTAETKLTVSRSTLPENVRVVVLEQRKI